MSTPAAPPVIRRTQGVAAVRALRLPSLRYVGGVLLVAAAYYGAAKLGQTLRYTASVSAIWPPAGFGIAVLYLWGLRWWPGVLLAELVVNTELYLDDSAYHVGSLVGQQVGNMAEIVVGALLLAARCAGIRGRWLALVGPCGIAGFVLLARTEPSVLRAAAMGTVARSKERGEPHLRGLRALGVLADN